MSDIYTSAATAACAHFRLGSQASASAEHYAASAWFRAAVDAAYGRGRAEATADIARSIRRELVCCDVYDRVAPLCAEFEAQQPGWGEAYSEWVDAIGQHDICYWGEASARLAESIGGGPDA